TREELAVILYRYSLYKEYDVSAQADLADYTDADAIGEFAAAAMKWANAEGIITGRTDTTLVPQGTATRAEAATMLMRFLEDFVKEDVGEEE
ncbi:MAG: S-layer homology domain-containing protein, partial [Clostridiales bacterium]|nr:S-layer homology domain-containing protein [Clostridiales bacterium]